MKVKVWMLVVVAFVLGSFVSVGVATANTKHLEERTCDDIVYYPNGSLVCEINLQSENDTIIVHELK